MNGKNLFKLGSSGGLAQSVEQRNHNPCVCGSTPQTAIILMEGASMKQKFFTFVFCVASFLVLNACSDNSESLTPSLPGQNSKKQISGPISAQKFVAPSTSAIDEKKANQYLNASAALVMLGEEWSLKIERAQGEEKILILKNYEKAKDQVCIRVGLLGMDEYNWITNVALKDSNNSEVFSKAGIKVN